MPENPVVVTGATGNIGRHLTRFLCLQGIPVRAISRSEQHLRPLLDLGAKPQVGTVEDLEFLVRAFTGARSVFTLIPPHFEVDDFRTYQTRIAENYAAAITAAGVTHVVNLSSIGAHRDVPMGPITGLRMAEQILNRLEGVHIVHLRPAFFMENHLTAIGTIQQFGAYLGVLRPDLALPMVATRDIAAVAAQYLAEPSFQGKTARELLGPRDYTMTECARILGTAIGKPDLHYRQIEYGQAHAYLVSLGVSPTSADLINQMYRAYNEGHVGPQETRSPDNTTPTRLEEFASTFAAVYRALARESASS